MNNAAMNIHVQVLMQAYGFNYLEIPGSGIVGHRVTLGVTF